MLGWHIKIGHDRITPYAPLLIIHKLFMIRLYINYEFDRMSLNKNRCWRRLN
jgi:hypothetical protein